MTRAAGTLAVLLAAVLAATSGCGGDGGGKKERPKKEKPAKADKDADKSGTDADSGKAAAKDGAGKDGDQGAAPAIGGGGMGAAGLMGALSQAGQPGPWDEPNASKGAKADEPHVAVIALGGGVSELENMSLLGGFGGSLLLRDVTTKLHEVAADEHVTVIVLRMGDVQTSMAQAEELRATIKAVRAQKPVHCHAETAGNLGYFLLSACESIGLAPTGGIAITGPALTPIYFKGLLDRFAVQADFIHIGSFKGAAEPFTRTGPSAEMKKTYDDILDGSYTRLLEAIAEGRKLDPGRAKELVDVGVFTDEEAKAAGLVDDVRIFEDWRIKVTSGAPWRKVAFKKPPGQDMGALMQMLGLQPRPRVTAPHVALIYAVGEVVDGRGSGGATSAFQEIASRRLSAALRAAADDDSVKAIVLRVDSPGGSALASEIIWHSVRYAKEKKPVVVSMGDLAASGGYYISSGATVIWAQPDTLTGSIGVVGGKILLGPALQRYGVNVVELGRGKRATIMSPNRKWSAEERKLIEKEMLAVYGRFKQRVGEGRGKTPEQVEEVAKGRVWTGAQAKALGLVDELGGLDDALADARKRGGLDADAPIDVYPPDPTLLELLEDLSGGGVHAPGGLLAAIEADLALLGGPSFASAALSTLRAAFHFRDHPIRVIYLGTVLRN